jgi:hypothetical protein
MLKNTKSSIVLFLKTGRKLIDLGFILHVQCQRELGTIRALLRLNWGLSRRLRSKDAGYQTRLEDTCQ